MFTATPRGPKKLLLVVSTLIWLGVPAPILETTMEKLVCTPKLNEFKPAVSAPKSLLTVLLSKYTLTSVAVSFKMY